MPWWRRRDRTLDDPAEGHKNRRQNTPPVRPCGRKDLESDVVRKEEKTGSAKSLHQRRRSGAESVGVECRSGRCREEDEENQVTGLGFVPLKPGALAFSESERVRKNHVEGKAAICK